MRPIAVLVLMTIGISGCHLVFPYSADPSSTAGDPSSLVRDAAVTGDASMSGDGVSLSDGAPFVDAVPSTGDAGQDSGTVWDGGPLQIISSPVTWADRYGNYSYDAEVNTTAPVTWSLLTKPAGMTVEPGTGLVQWNTTPRPIGDHEVVLHVTDGTHSDQQSYTLTVTVLPVNGLAPGELAHLALADPTLRARLAHGPLRGPRLARLFGPRGPLPAMARALSYVASCALGPDQRLRLPTAEGPLVINGALALAPEWQHGPCHRRCQQRVSACVYARVNAAGRQVPIGLTTGVWGLGGDGPDVPHRREGAFFGNLFAPTPSLFACRATDAPPPAAGRRCTLSREQGCWPVVSVGGCDERCSLGPSGFAACRVGQERYAEAITVLLR